MKNKIAWHERLIFRFTLPLLKKHIYRIADEKESGDDYHHQNSDCGFQLLEELGVKAATGE